MIKLALTTATLMTGALSGCINWNDGVEMQIGNPGEETVQVAEFTKLGVAGPYEVIVTQGDSFSVQASGPQNVIDHTEFRVENGELKIRTERPDGDSISWEGGDPKVTITITAPSIEAASIAGSGSIDIDNVEVTRFSGEIAGSGDIRVAQLSAENASFEIAGSGDVQAAGTTQRLTVEIAGSGAFENPDMNAEEADISIAGSGDVAANVTGEADISIAGSGDVNITGGAKCSISKVGGGDVVCS
ncbi:head GIN domain-containing protein [Sphingomicrobium sediminis]|uniref:DUF2807 domain-containing protein n=1 Tax=Sphingomicrobium sediminis TaxID=2950949 RepID=A0A9X2J410_9SPHN|nr:head GIN domain-containing protein [Sphingomicrobium sediminis]MCM8557876.1 DUF2807 domain-containing protein [Sphingomicrobium sediminis]